MSHQPDAPLNHLAGEPSLYLQQHAANPLDWYPWGEPAFSLARQRDCPVLLSIGYSSCYWCHVMEHEVFEMQDVAEFMNPRYVCIKVDREERPDVDAMYMQAAQLMTGGGGWPLNVWLTPDLRPVFAGTYFPKADFLNISAQILTAWETERDKFEEVGHELAAAISASVDKARPGQLSQALLDTAARAIVSHCDPHWGGLASRVKFPEPVLWEFLLRHYQRTGDEQVRAVLTLTLDSMHDGGLYDHVGGGWHRYSTDREWLVPHFEKMLYDNAQLAALYAHAARVLEEQRYAEAARDTLDFLRREMQLPDGSIAASYDASTREGEGAYYVWTPAQMREVAGDDADDLARVLGVEDAPNFRDHHGKVSGSVVTRRADDPHGLFAKHRPALQSARGQRLAPARDDKVVTAWNAMAVSAGVGSAALDYLLSHHLDADGKLRRASNGGRPASPGVLEDYALLAKALLDAHASNPGSGYLRHALRLIDYVEQHLANPDGGYFQTMDTDMPFARGMNIRDTVEPSGNSVIAHALLKAALLTGNLELHNRAGALLERFAGTMAASPLESAHWLSAVQLYLGPYYLVVVAASADEASADALITDITATTPALNYELARIDPATLPAQARALQPVLDHKPLVDGRATVYVCTYGSCSAPVHSVDEVRELLLAR